jgi:DNA repair protein RecN (Recombination protein N)
MFNNSQLSPHVPMLEELVIENLGVIEAAHLSLTPGLVVLTGETGAGKSMILNAIALLRGGKSDPALIRNFSAESSPEPLVVEARWRVDSHPEAAALVIESGGKFDDDGSVIAIRSVTPTRSKAHLGGRTVPAGVLGEFSEKLVTVHGQSQQLRLQTPTEQRRALDSFCGSAHLQAVTELGKTWSRLKLARAELDELITARESRIREAEVLANQLAEIEKISPQPGEYERVQTQVSRLAMLRLSARQCMQPELRYREQTTIQNHKMRLL